jgi:pimeloyl-ACP methyl ester carboxylesterase
MRYFSGFSLRGEDELFREILIDSDYTIAGFSYGAILAFEEAIESQKRVDRLILISPAFFQNRKESFKALQLRAWERDKMLYLESFLKSCAYPSSLNLKEYLKDGSKDELEFLLNYIWDRERLLRLKQKGVTIEIFLGQRDKIIDSKEALEFFRDIGKIYLFRDAGHILR